MKVKRQKHVKKVLTFYRNNFSIHPPFNVIVDGTFCKAALMYKVNIREQLPKYLDAEVQINTTSCIISECEALGALLYGPLKVLQQFGIKQCPHLTPIPASKCLFHMVRKASQMKTRLFVATQDPELSDFVRSIPGTPLLYLSHNAIILEDASTKTKNKAIKSEQQRTVDEQKTVRDLKTALFGEEDQSKKKHKKKKGGPNPLSCKKKKKNKTLSVAEGGVKKKRNRKRHKRSSLNLEHSHSTCN